MYGQFAVHLGVSTVQLGSSRSIWAAPCRFCAHLLGSQSIRCPRLTKSSVIGILSRFAWMVSRPSLSLVVYRVVYRPPAQFALHLDGTIYTSAVCSPLGMFAVQLRGLRSTGAVLGPPGRFMVHLDVFRSSWAVCSPIEYFFVAQLGSSWSN